MRLLKEIRTLVGSYPVKSGVYHYYRREYTQAAEFLRKALADDESTEWDRRYASHYLTLALTERADHVADEGSIELAIDLYREALTIRPSYPDLHQRLGLLHERSGTTEEAILAYRAAIDCAPDYVDAHFCLGICLIRAGRNEDGGAAMRRALELRQAQLERPVSRGLEALGRGDADGAIAAFDHAFRASPSLCRLHQEKALAFLAAEGYEKALVELDLAIALNSRYPDLHNYRGVVLTELERTGEAIEAFQTSLELAPSHPAPKLNLAFAMLRADDNERAEAELTRILEQHPGEPAATAQLEAMRERRSLGDRLTATRGGGR